MIEPNGERTFVVLPGMEQLWRAPWFKPVDMTKYDYIYLSGFQLTNPLVARATVDALNNRRDDAVVLFDVAARIKSVDKDILAELLHSGSLFTVMKWNCPRSLKAIPSTNGLPTCTRRPTSQ